MTWRIIKGFPGSLSYGGTQGYAICKKTTHYQVCHRYPIMFSRKKNSLGNSQNLPAGMLNSWISMIRRVEKIEGTEMVGAKFECRANEFKAFGNLNHIL